MAVPETITKLIERFDFHRQSHISSRDVYNETKLRQDYLDHFFIALGWDVYNTQGWSEQGREVSLEQPIKIQGTTDFIDYSFKIGRDLKFIAEAKAPRVRIKDNTNAAYQVRRYAWNAKLALCLLTNFDEFAVYDCTKRPSSSDAPVVARIEYFTTQIFPQNGTGSFLFFPRTRSSGDRLTGLPNLPKERREPRALMMNSSQRSRTGGMPLPRISP